MLVGYVTQLLENGMCSPGERGFADNLGEESCSQWEGQHHVCPRFSFGTSGERKLWARPLCEQPGGNLCTGARRGLEMCEMGSSRTAKSLSWEVGQLPHGDTEPCSTPLLSTLPVLRITSCYPKLKCSSELFSAVFCPVWGLACSTGVAHLGDSPSCCCWWWQSSGWWVPWQAGTSASVIAATLWG